MGAEMPDGLSLPEQQAYTALRNIGISFWQGVLSQELATKEKRKVRATLQRALEQKAFDDKLTAYHVYLIKASEFAKSAYLKNRTLENADHLVNVLDGIERPALPKGEV